MDFDIQGLLKLAEAGVPAIPLTMLAVDKLKQLLPFVPNKYYPHLAFGTGIALLVGWALLSHQDITMAIAIGTLSGFASSESYAAIKARVNDSTETDLLAWHDELAAREKALIAREAKLQASNG